MPEEQDSHIILAKLSDAVVDYDEVLTRELSEATLEQGVDPYHAIMDGLAKGMERVGDLYVRQEYFVPELLLCADALYAGLDVLRPHLKVEETAAASHIVLGVIRGDIHDIGKNLVKIMFDAAGWVVHDLGKNVPLERFLEEQNSCNARMVGISALMTTSMMAMPKLITMLREQDPTVCVLVGGAPLNPQIAAQYGADGYAKDAATAVQSAVRLLEQSQGASS